LGFASLILDRNARASSEGFPILKLGDASIASKRLAACSIVENRVDSSSSVSSLHDRIKL